MIIQFFLSVLFLFRDEESDLEDENPSVDHRTNSRQPYQINLPTLDDIAEVNDDDDDGDNDDIQSYQAWKQGSAKMRRRIGRPRRRNEEMLDHSRVPIFKFRCVPEEQEESDDWWVDANGDNATADNSSDKLFQQELERYLFTRSHHSVSCHSSEF